MIDNLDKDSRDQAPSVAQSKRKKVNRRTAKELNKKFACLYNCGKSYATDAARNMHMREKHNDVTKTGATGRPARSSGCSITCLQSSTSTSLAAFRSSRKSSRPSCRRSYSHNTPVSSLHSSLIKSPAVRIKEAARSDGNGSITVKR